MVCPVSRCLRKIMDLRFDSFDHPGCYGHSESLFPFASAASINALDADVIHLHWINGDFLSVGELGKIRKPVVWTLHDNWAYCGNEFCTVNFRYRDGYTEATRPDGEKGPDFARIVWEQKKAQWKNFHPMFVSPSQWNADRLTESLLFENVPCRVIRNPLDLKIFSPGDRTAARRKFSLDQDRLTLLFGAEAILRAEDEEHEHICITANAAWKAPSGTLSTMFQAGALIELSGDAETAFDIYYETYDIHELPELKTGSETQTLDRMCNTLAGK